MLREFEDHENLLAEMDEQVDVYRENGKHEAAARLEDQLQLIHEKFQDLLMKFELFQQQPAVDYEPRLARVSRQLSEIRQKVGQYLTKGASPFQFCAWNIVSNALLPSAGRSRSTERIVRFLGRCFVDWAVEDKGRRRRL